VLLLLIRREEEATHPFCAEEEEEERVFIKFFPVVVVVVDLIIVILFLVCRVAQKQLLDAILIILVTQSCFLLSSRVYKRVKKCGKERKKKERSLKRKMKTRREKFSREKLGFRNRRSQISLLFYCLTAFQTKVFQRCCCSNTAQHVSSIKQRFQKKLRRIRREKVFVKPNYWKETLLKYSYYNTTKRA